MRRIHLRTLAALASAVVLAWSCPSQAISITSQTEATPWPGVKILTIRTASPTTRAWAAVVDLCSDYVHVDASKASTSTRTTGTWATSAGVQLATNGDFFKTGPLRVYGDAVGSGAHWPASQTGTDPAYASEWYYDNYGWIAFGPDWVDFSHTEYVKKHPGPYPIREGWRPDEVGHVIPTGTIAMVSGFPELVVEGTVVTCSSPTDATCFPDRSDMRDRNPRTAMGITEDRRSFILLVVDGRTSVSAGMYGTELAWLMGKLGAWQAFNLDGGGSSQFWQSGKGYVNDVVGNDLGAGTRAVANHWGVFAGTAGGKSKRPGHCVDYLVESILNRGVNANASTTDFDGDGKADACIRGADGMHCSRGGDGKLGDDEPLVGLTDTGGWHDMSNYATLRMGDLDGDGRADLCSRANAGVRCWRSDTGPFATAIDGPELSDALGWSAEAYYPSLMLADLDGDAKDDLCARAAKGLRCYLSTGGGFGDAIQTDLFSDAAGFDDPDHGGSLRMGDIDGDGAADVCGRGADGVQCYLSDGAGFPTAVAGPGWADANGWSRVRYWSTIRLVDVDGDGKADICARSSKDFRCHLSTGTAFGDPVVKAILTDADGWDEPSRYSTIRMADIDGDGDSDLCARDAARLVCWPWEGAAFGEPIDGPELPDGEGWTVDRLYTGIRLADVTGDRKADVCARDDSGLACWISDGKGFPTRIAGPAWAGRGWEHPSVFGTLLIAGPRCVPTAEVCNGSDDDCDGVVDDGCVGEPDGGVWPEGGADARWPGLEGGASDAGAGPSGMATDEAGGCGCGVVGRLGSLVRYWWVVVLGAMVVGRRRRSRPHATLPPCLPPSAPKPPRAARAPTTICKPPRTT